MGNDISEIYERTVLLGELKITGNLDPFPLYKITPQERKSGIWCFVYHLSKKVYESVGDVYYFKANDEYYTLELVPFLPENNILEPIISNVGDMVDIFGLKGLAINENNVMDIVKEKYGKLTEEDIDSLAKSNNKMGYGNLLRLFSTIKYLLEKTAHPDVYLCAFKSDPQRVAIYKNIIKSNVGVFGGIYSHIKEFETNDTDGYLLLKRKGTGKRSAKNPEFQKPQMTEDDYNRNLNERYNQKSGLVRVKI